MNGFLNTVNGFDFALIMIIIVGALYHKSTKSGLIDQYETWKFHAIEAAKEMKEMNVELFKYKAKERLDKIGK